MVNADQPNNSRDKPLRRSKWVILLICVASGLWLTVPFDIDLRTKSAKPVPDELLQALNEFSTQHLVNNFTMTFTNSERKLARFGQALFFDPRFSANQKVSCASCHQPEKGFSDGLPTAQGLLRGKRRTPDVRNTFAHNWFFWDGRADSLESQALGPIESPDEHGISRTHLVKTIKRHYKLEYESNFGAWPESLDSDLPAEAIPTSKSVPLPRKLAAYSLASLDSFAMQDDILKLSRRLKAAPAAAIDFLANDQRQAPKNWVESWESLPTEVRNRINEVFTNFGRAIAQYERGLISIDSQFDQFLHRAQKHDSIEDALNDSFGKAELGGLEIFVGPGECSSCHSGPLFMDHQFHNIGLPLIESDEGSNVATLDLGRATGLAKALSNPFNCRSDLLKMDSESCRELEWLSTDNLELVGAFKTPSLRNIAERAPYMHDGRFKSLDEVIEHYNLLPEKPGIGHREETLRPLSLNETQKQDLIAFLRSLSSSTVDLSQDES